MQDVLELGRVTDRRPPFRYSALTRVWFSDTDAQGVVYYGMPCNVAGTREVMKYLAREISPHTYLNLMMQYAPAGWVTGDKYSEINRCITAQEYETALTLAKKAGLYRFDRR